MSNFSVDNFHGYINQLKNTPGMIVRELSPQASQHLFEGAFGDSPGSGVNPKTAGTSDSLSSAPPNPFGQPVGGTYGTPSVGLPKYSGGGTSRYYDFTSPLGGSNLQDYLQ